MHEQQRLQVWDRLFRGETLEDLGIPTIDGRLDLRGLDLPDPTNRRSFEFNKTIIREIDPAAIFSGVEWRNLDFSGSVLRSMRLVDAEIENCRFDNCQMQDLRIWCSHVSNSSFRNANLQNAALGAIKDSECNKYFRVDFSGADMRRTVYKATTFEGCLFRRAKLEKIDFQSSVFSNCSFEGELRDVLFYGRGFRMEKFPENEMNNVDFSSAKLRFVEFRGLKLDRVRFPEDDEHIIIKNVVKTIQRLISVLKSEKDDAGRKLVAFLEISLERAPSDQAQSIINLYEIEQYAGSIGVERLKQALRKI